MKIISLLASYLDTDIRIKNFELCLDSILEQTKHADMYAFSICVGINTQLPLENILEKLSLLKLKTNCVIVWQQSGIKLSQFQGYWSLIGGIKPNSSDFYIFSDDDDIWHPSRVETFIKYLLRDYKNSKCICIPTYALNPYTKNVNNSRDVHPNNVYISNNDMRIEYVCYAIECKEFYNYLKNNLDALHYRLFDLFFAEYAKSLCNNNIYKQSPDNWMYYYRIAK